MPIKFSLHLAKLDKKGDAPIRASIFICGQRFLTSVGYSINKDKWNGNRVDKGYNNAHGITYSTINSRLAQIEKYFIIWLLATFGGIGFLLTENLHPNNFNMIIPREVALTGFYRSMKGTRNPA